jgi:hypothetical protein
MEELREVYPNYDVLIRNNKTGEVRTRHMSLPWFEYSLYWWTEGNFGCDCNRYLEFERAGERTDDPINDELVCGDGKDRHYSVIMAIFPDGKEETIDDEVATVEVGSGLPDQLS